MRLVRTTVRQSDPVGRTRLCAEVAYDRGRPAREELWIEVPSSWAPALDPSGTPWVAILLPLAVALEEPLWIEVPADPRVVAAARRVEETWRAWYATTALVPVDASGETPAPAAPPRRTLAYFSGGVDSFFTALHGPSRPVDDLVFLEGFDLRLEHEAGRAAARATATAAARALGLPLHVVATNLRGTRWNQADWALVAHGAALAGIALAIGGGHDRAAIPASIWSGDSIPWGSHEATDPRFSSGALEIVADGHAADRFDKVAAIATHEAVRSHLRVCYRSRQGVNCSHCTKCLLTMAMLDAVGALAPSGSSFLGVSDYLLRLRHMDARFPSDRRHLGRTLAAADARGHAALADAVRAVLAKRTGWTHRVPRAPSPWTRWRRRRRGLGRTSASLSPQA